MYVLLWFTSSDCPFGIFKLFAIVLSVLLPFTSSDYPFCIFLPLCCLFFFDLRLLITPLVSFCHCVVCASIYVFWLPFWYIFAIVLSVLLWFTSSDYPFGIFLPLSCLSFFDLRLLITPLVSFCHCVVCPSLIYVFWLPLSYLFAIVLSVLLWFTSSDYPFGIFLPLCCLFFFDLRLLITPLVSFCHCVVCPSSIYVFWLPLWYFQIFCHCVVCPSLIYVFWLPLWYLFAIVLYVLLRFTSSDYPFGIFLPLCCMSFFDLRLLITPLVFSNFLPLCCLFFFDLRLLITPLVSFCHCVVCPSLIYVFWLPLWYLFAIVLSVLLWFTSSDYPFSIFLPLCCLSFFDLRLLITPLVSFCHCVVCPSLIYVFWLPLWYLFAIVLSVLLWFTSSDCSFGNFLPLCCLSFFDLRLLITPLVFSNFLPLCCLSFFDLRLLIIPLVSFCHCVVCPSSIYVFWLPLWYLFAIVLYVLLRFTSSDYPFGIFKLFAIVLSVLLWCMSSDYPFGIFLPLCCLSFFDLHLLITLLVSFCHCVVCPSIYVFWLPLWYFQTFCHCVVCPSLIYVFWLPLWYLQTFPQWINHDKCLTICYLCPHLWNLLRTSVVCVANIMYYGISTT